MPQMEDNIFYDLNPPATIKGKKFYRVQCEYQVPNNPDEYAVKGIPEGGKKEEPFLLRFSKKGRVGISRSKNQGPRILEFEAH